MKHPHTSRALRRLPVIASLAFAGITAVAQAPAGTAENPSSPLNCWPLQPCPPGTLCGPGGGLGMSQKLGPALPVGLVSGGAFSSLTGSGLPPIRRIDDNWQVADLRMLAPSALSGMVVTSAKTTLYRGSLLINDVADQASFNFASGSLPALQYVGQIPLSPSTTGGYWLLSLEVQGNVAASRPKGARVPANFQVVCQLPVTVQQWVNQ